MSAVLPADPWSRVLLVVGLMVAWLAVLGLYQRTARPSAEMVRKLFHLGGGLIALSLPWLFDDVRPVIVLAAACAALFAALRTVPALARGPGQVLAGVKRTTVGEFCFSVSVCLLFWLAKDNRLLFGVPVLVLAVADSFAALVGEEYGKRHFATLKGQKSMEGSSAFFLAAFLCVHVPVLLWSGAGREESLLIALSVALLVTMAEASAWWGLDNLIIPLFSYGLLRVFLRMTTAELIVHLTFLLGLALFVRGWRRRTTLADDALFGGVAWGYVVWAVSDWRWIIPPLALFVSYLMSSSRTVLDHERVFHFPVLLATAAAGQLWLVLYWASGRPELFSPFAAAFGGNLAIVALVRDAHARPSAPRLALAFTDAGKGILLIVLPAAITVAQGGAGALLFGLGTLAVLVSTFAFALAQPGLARYPIDATRWVRQAVATTAGSALCLIPYAVRSWLSGAW